MPIAGLESYLRLFAEYQVEFVIVGGVAASLHGASFLTFDFDICYARSKPNVNRLVTALKSVRARLRGAPENVPFQLDTETLLHGMNFTFTTDIGNVDILGELMGVGGYAEAREGAAIVPIFGHEYAVLSLKKLIASKRAAGRRKDLIVLPELEALYEDQSRD